MRPTVDLSDDNEEIVQPCSAQFRDFGRRRRYGGRIRTIRCKNDNQLLRTLLDEPGDDCVIVVDGAASTERALLGDMLAAKGVKNGWSGCVILGAIRDSQVLSTIDFGVKALGVNPTKSTKLGDGAVDVPVEFGGARFDPGAWIYCDEDGVLVSPQPLE